MKLPHDSLISKSSATARASGSLFDHMYIFLPSLYHSIAGLSIGVGVSGVRHLRKGESSE
jgi:hypothetical protein